MSRPAAPTSPADPIVAARSAGLRYVTDTEPGISRERVGRTFRYRDAHGRLVTDAATVARIKHLAIPRAWTGVWICSNPAGHIQATGRDARGRKQYRYHSEWRAVRDETKYERILAFARALPGIRRRVARDLRQPGLGRDKVVAAIVRLLETTLIRVGNEEYARNNGSFGLSTMRDRHVAVRKGTLHFEFRGKAGKRHRINLHDPQLAGIVRRTQDLPGQELFQYVDDTGQPQRISSEDVNAYLQTVAGEAFSAKDFRTWAGTVLAAIALRQFERFDTKAQAKKNLVAAIERVAERLGNTPAVCRTCYIHPAILQSYLDGKTVETVRVKAEEALRQGLNTLSAEEGAVLAFLQQELESQNRSASQPPRSNRDMRTALKASIRQHQRSRRRRKPRRQERGGKSVNR